VPGSCLLDTNVVVALFKGDPAITQNLQHFDEVFLPVPVLGELYYGARKSGRISDNLTQVDRLAASSVVLGCDLATAHQYALIKDDLRAKGLPIPENDLWIAAIARQHHLTLATRDDHFLLVEGLDTARW
jgi:tRNA(fMet)-specific endonuclease VapC